MKLKKKVDLSISRYGELKFEENANGNYSIYHGHWGKSNIGTPELIFEMIKKIVPNKTEVQLYRDKTGIKISNNLIDISFQFVIKEDSVILFYKGMWFKENKHVFATLDFKTEFNSLSLFKILLTLNKEFINNKRKDSVLSQYPTATEIIPNADSGYLDLKEHGYTYHYKVINDIPRIDSISLEDQDGRTENLNEDAIKGRIKWYQEMLETLQSLKKEDIKPIAIKSDAELEAERKERNEARKLVPRIPELQAMSTYNLVQLLHWSRTPGYNYRDYGVHLEHRWDPEQLKCELSHREHLPNKAEKKELRKEAATQHHGSKKIK